MLQLTIEISRMSLVLIIIIFLVNIFCIFTKYDLRVPLLENNALSTNSTFKNLILFIKLVCLCANLPHFGLQMLVTVL